MRKKTDNGKGVHQSADSMRFEAITDYGFIRISERVIAAIVKKAACAVNGVTRIADKSSFIDTVTKILYSRKSYDNAIKLDISGDNVRVELKINAAYDENIPQLALRIQNTVSEEVRQITGMNVLKVDVIISEVEARGQNIDTNSSDLM